MTKAGSDEKIVPLGVVFITIGFIAVGLAAAILFIRPTVSQAAAASTPLPVVTVVITPIPEATAVSETGTAVSQENNTEITLPANVVSLNDAPRGTLDNQPQRIVIPNLDVDAPVVDVGLAALETGGETYYQWQVPAAYEAGWHNTSAPLGQVGNTVLNGHHNIFGEVFGKLVDLEVGAEIIVYDKIGSHTYTVADVQILPERDQPLEVRVENASWIQPTADERLTLVTCWPHSDNSHRLIVVAFPTNPSSN
ncbi:MAG: sortase [Ardenticatenaceae bacterium]|nr:sortase [Anaerolineales bacterium]MCB9009736.1 sortase [Ardenticatenaceae bacterium]